MEVFETEKYYIFVNKGKSLWWNRTTSEFQVKCGEKFFVKFWDSLLAFVIHQLCEKVF